MKKSTRKNRKYGKIKIPKFTAKNITLFAGVIIAVAAVITAAAVMASGKPDASFTAASKSLYEYIFNGTDIEETIKEELINSYGSTETYTVFLSVTDGEKQAAVVNASGATLKKAWSAAESKASDYTVKNKIETVYLKADIVNYMNKVTLNEADEIIKKPKAGQYFRYGVSFGDGFSAALLEAELNANGMVDYDGDEVFLLKNINKYLSLMKRQQLKEVPKEVIIFSCRGYIYDEGKNYTLNYEQDYNYGRRISEQTSRETAVEVTSSSVDFLRRNLNGDGSFVYGYFPRYDKNISSYNILRHTGTIWSMVNHYKLTGDGTIKKDIDLALSYLLEQVVWQDNETAYILEEKAGEIKIGGSGIALLVLITYGDTFQTSEYNSLCKALGNGILAVQDSKTGKYNHVLYYNTEGQEDYSLKEKSRTVFYDGESTFGLCYLYSLTNDKKYLDGAQAAVEMFIREDYTQYGDHWVSYAMNEITKHIPDERYFEFGLRNAMENLNKICNAKTTSHIYTELLMSAFDLYDRIISSGTEVAYLEQFDAKKFIGTIFYRADFMLNGYFYPEFAIYMRNPPGIMKTFFIRQDIFRVRIDDVQHFVGGYYMFARDYEKLLKYQRDLT